MKEYYRGSINLWECDENWHANVRFYVVKMMEALGCLADDMGMAPIFCADTPVKIRIDDLHIRYMAEVRPGRPIFIQGCTIEIGETSADLFFEMVHSLTNQTAAAFRVRLHKVNTKSGETENWSAQERDHLSAVSGTHPDHCAPRSVDLSITPRQNLKLEMAQKAPVTRIGHGMVMAEDCDIFGYMHPHMFIGRVSDSVPNMLSLGRDEIADRIEKETGIRPEIGGAVVEYRLSMLKYPKLGDRFEIHSAIKKIEAKIKNLSHWVVDPKTDEVFCATDAYALSFDLETRKAVTTSEDEIKAMQSRINPYMGV